MKQIKRDIRYRYGTVYYTDGEAPVNQYTIRGAAKSMEGAKRAAIVRIILEQYTRAHIVDRKLGIILLTLKRTRVGITVHYGRAE